MAYGFIFISYFSFRIIKALNKNSVELIPKKQIVATASSLFFETLIVSFIIINTNVANATVDDVKTKSNLSISIEDTKKDVVLKDGKYHGEGMGNNGNMELEVTIKEGKITDIEFIKFIDDKEFFDIETDGQQMISKVIEAQSYDVDGISGATYSSNGFLDVVKDALEKVIVYNIDTIRTITKNFPNRFTLIKSSKRGLQEEIKVIL